MVGIDGSESASRALRWAVREADLRGIGVSAVTAGDSPELTSRGAIDASAGSALDGVLISAVGSSRAAGIERLVDSRPPGEALVAAAEGAEMLVIGARGLGDAHGVGLGSVSRHCLRRAPCPVVIVRGEAAKDLRPLGRVVVGVDDSAGSRGALQWAVEEARIHDATLEAVHAWHLPLTPTGRSVRAPADLRCIEAVAAESLERTVAEVDASGLVAPVMRSVLPDGPAGAILGLSRAADLVVVGVRDSNNVHASVWGSVSNQLARSSACPVVVVPTR